MPYRKTPRWTKAYEKCGCHWCKVSLMDVPLTFEEHRFRLMAPIASAGSKKKCLYK